MGIKVMMTNDMDSGPVASNVPKVAGVKIK